MYVRSSTFQNAMAATHCSVFVFKRVHCLPYPASSLDCVVGMVDEWLSLDERPIFQSISKKIALQLVEGLERKIFETKTAKCSLVCDDPECYPASSSLGVAGMVAEWLWAHLSICLSHHLISAQLGARARSVGLSRGG